MAQISVTSHTRPWQISRFVGTCPLASLAHQGNREACLVARLIPGGRARNLQVCIVPHARIASHTDGR